MKRISFANQCVTYLLILLALFLCAPAAASQDFLSPGRHKITFTSSYDYTLQSAYVIVPRAKSYGDSGFPVLVALHTWSATMEQVDMYGELQHLAEQCGWLYLFPNFRGKNDNPLACGSDAACSDVIDALEWARTHFRLNRCRTYLAGMSGGGHMAMLVASRFPARWTAVSAWVGISDLASWYTMQANREYGADMRRCMGGAPDSGPAVAAQYRLRSPLCSIAGAKDLPFDLAAGRDDGHGINPVPIRQTLTAFNAIARSAKADTVSEEEMQQLSVYNGVLTRPQPSDTASDITFTRKIFLRRYALNSRVTIFSGGHEWLPKAVVEWLGVHVGSGMSNIKR